ncbi:hypothetical protein TRFO_42256 [Tritrichomonas foetus]|uniref:Initiator binding domain-containing protein n=1 Tax=Tritrichomonas foetus TaxID=1144522 RepID=A0A1J4L1J6_9EUKA|nr:hypothetical protein TRFO_42256 [Tritrichomonas foetus]|eukprot:OHT15830.1 hypothetical protein TRFO_42256 [Tritrichomonas foetus]
MSLQCINQASSTIDSCIPKEIWDSLTNEDRSAYFRMKLQFHQNQRMVGKESRIVSFHKELLNVRSFIERREEGIEERSIVSGVCFAGRFICVNTRQLKCFLGRCKSSINGCFQQLGYVALKTKTKARNCILSVMHTLVNNQGNLRQWTVRCSSNAAMFSIVSTFPDIEIPEIKDEELVLPIKKTDGQNENQNLIYHQKQNNNNLINNKSNTYIKNGLFNYNSFHNKTLGNSCLKSTEGRIIKANTHEKIINELVLPPVEQLIQPTCFDIDESEWGIEISRDNFYLIDYNIETFELNEQLVEQIHPISWNEDATFWV